MSHVRKGFMQTPRRVLIYVCNELNIVSQRGQECKKCSRLRKNLSVAIVNKAHDGKLMQKSTSIVTQKVVLRNKTDSSRKLESHNFDVDTICFCKNVFSDFRVKKERLYTRIVGGV